MIAPDNGGLGRKNLSFRFNEKIDAAHFVGSVGNSQKCELVNDEHSFVLSLYWCILPSTNSPIIVSIRELRSVFGFTEDRYRNKVITPDE